MFEYKVSFPDEQLMKVTGLLLFEMYNAKLSRNNDLLVIIVSFKFLMLEGSLYCFLGKFNCCNAIFTLLPNDEFLYITFFSSLMFNFENITSAPITIKVAKP